MTSVPNFISIKLANIYAMLNTVPNLDFEKCGGKGKRRLSDNPDAPKLGRPPRNHENSEEPGGVRITPLLGNYSGKWFDF